MVYVRPKKRLGQHFLKDLTIAERIVSCLKSEKKNDSILEIGSGTGVLSDFLLQRKFEKLVLMDIDLESIEYLRNKYSSEQAEIVHGDFLKMDMTDFFGESKFSIIGNFPYNISSQIFFKVLDIKDQVDEIVCMLQKEVAQRIASSHGSKAYGILSVFLQAYFDIEYLFTVGPEVFNPPPKVESAVIRLRRNKVIDLGCDEKEFRKVIKEGFQKRRKTLRNALKGLNLPENVIGLEVMNKRAEQLTVQYFVDLTNQLK